MRLLEAKGLSESSKQLRSSKSGARLFLVGAVRFRGISLWASETENWCNWSVLFRLKPLNQVYMRDYDQETVFLKRMLSYNESAESRQIEQAITRVQRDSACVFKASCRVA